MYYVGLDVASKGSFVYAKDRKGKKIESKEIPTDKHGYRSYFKQWKGKAVEVAVEAGGHTRWIYDELRKMGIEVYVANPNKVKLIAETKRKTGKVDAKVLAELLRIGGLPERVHMAEGDSRELRDILKARQQLVKSATSLMNHILSHRHYKEVQQGKETDQLLRVSSEREKQRREDRVWAYNKRMEK